jgi:biotin synthase-related radical SAM superfamily protein
MAENTATKTDNRALKEALYKELELKVDIGIEGVSIEPEDLNVLLNVHEGTDTKLDKLSEKNTYRHPDSKLPGSFYLPNGILAGFHQDLQSKYGLVPEDGKAVLYKFGRKKERLAEVVFRKRPAVLDQLTSDGIPYRRIAGVNPNGSLQVHYSNECSLKDNGGDCIFCGINPRADSHREVIVKKNSRHIAEVYDGAINAGEVNRLNLSGGFVPERRELEYYLDVAEEIKSRLGVKDFIGTVAIGAPLDFSVIDKYKEAGWRDIRLNIEVWDKNIRKVICPGKEKICGGWDNWVNALEYAVKVFGKGHVGSNIVGGLEPKQSVLEGVEYLASKGVICFASVFHPCAGTPLEGFRTPEVAWHLDLASKITGILRKYGFTQEQLQHNYPSTMDIHYMFLIEDEYFENGKLKEWKFPKLKTKNN